MEKQIKSYCDDLTTRIIKAVESYPESKGISAIILTGSLGRDEGTFHFEDDDKNLILDSDVELALVYKTGNKKSAEIVKSKLIESFTEELNPMTINETRVKRGYNFNYSIIPPRKSSIFMYDLYNGSKTIWGKDLIKEKICEYDKYEAKRIVANRIGEITCVKLDNDSSERLIAQWEGKLMLALASAYCILNDAYSSKYEYQREFMLEQKENIDKIFGPTFMHDYNNCFLFLRKGGEEYKVDEENLIQYVKSFKELFDTQKIKHPKINSTSRKLKYIIACIKSKAELNPFTCEEDILDNLILYFYNRNKHIDCLAKNWKNILY